MYKAVKILFLTLGLSSCSYDMANYIDLSHPNCSNDKVVEVSENIYNIDSNIYSEINKWLKNNLRQDGYDLVEESKKPATMLVTINHEAADVSNEAPVIHRKGKYEQDPEKLQMWRHRINITMEDLICGRETKTITVEMDTFESNFLDALPELMESLEEGFANTKGPKSHTVITVERKL
tara:strand:+ start:8416 stop:8952 length:537 start_codon:yes stop_codon:yes gene_type:complete